MSITKELDWVYLCTPLSSVVPVPSSVFNMTVVWRRAVNVLQFIFIFNLSLLDDSLLGVGFHWVSCGDRIYHLCQGVVMLGGFLLGSLGYQP